MSTTGASEVTLMVPTGWSLVDLDRLLDDTLISEITTILRQLDEDFADERADDLRREFQALRQRIGEEHVLLMAVRAREDLGAFDVMTLAIQGASELDASGVTNERKSESLLRADNVETTSDAKRDLHGKARFHRSEPTRGIHGGLWPSRVQVVLPATAVRRGFVLTLLSSRTNSGHDLEREGLLVAESLLEDHASAKGDEG
ncbi:MAG TPA: hypothetical protein VMB05_17445 [Solirubrobacteraceae bacterium]|nr:hypothetical protein [Solirubrobacteraceae bacterium]